MYANSVECKIRFYNYDSMKAVDYTIQRPDVNIRASRVLHC